MPSIGAIRQSVERAATASLAVAEASKRAARDLAVAESAPRGGATPTQNGGSKNV